LFSAVRAAVRRRKSRSYGADIEAAEGQDTRDTGSVQSPVRRIPRTSSKENSHLPEILPPDAPMQGRQRTGAGDTGISKN